MVIEIGVVRVQQDRRRAAEFLKALIRLRDGEGPGPRRAVNLVCRHAASVNQRRFAGVCRGGAVEVVVEQRVQVRVELGPRGEPARHVGVVDPELVAVVIVVIVVRVGEMDAIQAGVVVDDLGHGDRGATGEAPSAVGEVQWTQVFVGGVLGPVREQPAAGRRGTGGRPLLKEAVAECGGGGVQVFRPGGVLVRSGARGQQTRLIEPQLQIPGQQVGQRIVRRQLAAGVARERVGDHWRQGGVGGNDDVAARLELEAVAQGEPGFGAGQRLNIAYGERGRRIVTQQVVSRHGRSGLDVDPAVKPGAVSLVGGGRDLDKDGDAQTEDGERRSFDGQEICSVGRVCTRRGSLPDAGFFWRQSYRFTRIAETPGATWGAQQLRHRPISGGVSRRWGRRRRLRS